MSATGAPAADSGPVSLSGMVDILDARDREQEQETVEQPTEVAPVETEIPEAVPAVEGEGEQETASADEEGEGVEPAKPAVDPPPFWSAENKELFSKLPAEIQEAISTVETQRASASSKAIQESAEAKKAAETERTRLVQLNEQLATILPKAETTFRSRWEGADWVKLATEVGADQYAILKAQYDQEREELSQLHVARNETERATLAQFIQEEATKLSTVCPDLADPKEGAARKEQLGKFLIGSGIQPDNLARITAAEAAIAYDAMRWRQSQAKAKELAAKPKSAPPPQKPASKPSAAPAAGSPKSARLNELSRKRSLSIDEHTELLNLRDQAP